MGLLHLVGCGGVRRGSGVLLALMLQGLRGYSAFFKNRAAAARQTLFVRECSVHDRVKAFTVIEERAAAWGERDQ